MRLKKLELNKKNAVNYLLWGVYLVCTLGILAYYLYYNRFVVLACHDSMMEFAYAKIYGWKWAYKYSFEYSLMRGRVSVIFPAVISFRFFVHEYGNYLAVWLLQYAPVYANIILISSLIAKRAKSTYGVMYALFFATFLQINVWHSLIICYPLEFMYALFIMIWGLYLFQSYLEKPKLWKMIVSCIFFYESMQSYEAFLVSSLCYAILALNHVLKTTSGQVFKKRLWKFVKILIPHASVGVFFVIEFELLHIFPVFPDRAVLAVNDHGTLSGAFKTWVNFSFAMFPMKSLLDVRRNATDKMDIKSIRNLMVMFFGGAGALSGLILMYKEVAKASLEKVKKINRTLIVIGAMGLSINLFFALPHAMTETYQSWVIQGASLAYVPTTICYFGMVVAIICIIGLIANWVARKNIVFKSVYGTLVVIFFVVGAMVTVCINDAFRELAATTNAYASMKAQTFYALCINDDFDSWDVELLYTPYSSHMGIHGDIQRNESMMEAIVGDDYDVEVLNFNDEFLDAYPNYDNVAMFKYDEDSKVGVLMHVIEVDEIQDDTLDAIDESDEDKPVYLDVYVSGDVVIVSSHGGHYTIYVEDVMITEFDVDAWSGTTVELPYEVLSSDIDIRQE